MLAMFLTALAFSTQKDVLIAGCYVTSLCSACGKDGGQAGLLPPLPHLKVQVLTPNVAVSPYEGMLAQPKDDHHC